MGMVIFGRIDLDRLPKREALVVAYVLIAVIGVFDYFTGSEISLSLFYLLPVFLAFWVGGRWAGWAVAVTAMAVELTADLAAGHVYSHVLIIYWNAAIRFGFLGVLLLLLSALKNALQAESRMARQDFLTGVLNSRAFYEIAENERLRALRYRRFFTLVYLDLDDFKRVNDQEGHHAGDAILRLVAQALRSALRATDVVARLGGDEFVLLLPESDARRSRLAITRLQKRLRAVLSALHERVTLSFGAVTFLQPPDQVDAMLKLADRLMYEAKHRGKNRFVWGTYPDPGPGKTAKLRKRAVNKY